MSIGYIIKRRNISRFNSNLFEFPWKESRLADYVFSGFKSQEFQFMGHGVRKRRTLEAVSSKF